MSVYARRYSDGDAAMLAYARAFKTYIERGKLDVSFVRAQLDGDWTVFTLGDDADPEQVVGGTPLPVPAQVAQTLCERRRHWSQVAGDIVLHHHPPLYVRIDRKEETVMRRKRADDIGRFGSEKGDDGIACANCGHGYERHDNDPNAKASCSACHCDDYRPDLRRRRANLA